MFNFSLNLQHLTLKSWAVACDMRFVYYHVHYFIAMIQCYVTSELISRHWHLLTRASFCSFSFSKSFSHLSGLCAIVAAPVQAVKTTRCTCTTRDCPRHCWPSSLTQWRAFWTRTRRRTTPTSLWAQCVGGLCPMEWVHLVAVLCPRVPRVASLTTPLFSRSPMCLLLQTVKEQSRLVFSIMHFNMHSCFNPQHENVICFCGANESVIVTYGQCFQTAKYVVSAAERSCN